MVKAQVGRVFRVLKERLGLYWSMTKGLQTGLLLVTGIAGFSSARCPALELPLVAAMAGSLFLAIAGSTVLNMYLDRDIDAQMNRTQWRPLPSGRVAPGEALALGLFLSAAGVAWGTALAPLYGLVLLAGLLLDVVVYTLWLKRRTPWSILWGGISGGMPVLAGRVLGLGGVDSVGLLLALTVVLWIPTHILTFSLIHADDYARAGVPVFPNTHGPRVTRRIISLSTAGAAVALCLAAAHLQMSWGVWRAVAALGVGLVALAAASYCRPSPRLDFGLFKAASLYMLGGMGLLIVASFVV